MNPDDLTPFGLNVEFLNDGRVLLRIGAMLYALSPRQVADLRAGLGVGTVTVRNETPHALDWQLRSSPSPRAGGKDYVLTIVTQPPVSTVTDLKIGRKPELRLTKPRKKKEIP